MKLLDPENVGAEAVRQALAALDPKHDLAYDRVFGEPGAAYAPHTYKVEGALRQLIANQNELAAEVAALKQRPFG